MAKKTIGSIYKGKEGKGDYVKITEDVILKAGTFLNLENKTQKLASVQWLLDNGKIDAAAFEKRTNAINKMPDFVRFDVVLNSED